MSNYPRWQSNILRNALTKRRVMILSGPRQCGKTTLAKTIGGADALYRNLDEPMWLRAANEDPTGFVSHDNSLLIIDEVQHAPVLLRAIKAAVDKDKRPGRFLITGSAYIQAVPGANESLAGRAGSVRLRPLAFGEQLRKLPNFLPKAFAQDFSEKDTPLMKKDLLEIAMKGGFPEALIQDTYRDCAHWHHDYIDRLLERDLRVLANIERQDAMRNLIEVLAAWSSKLMQVSSIGSSLALSRPTLDSYINLLESLFLIDRVHPWHKTDYDRIGKQDKLFMTDSGLMSAILNWNPDQVLLNSDMSGKLIETWVYNELSAQIEAQPLKHKLYHYRDRQHREIDFIIEREDGALLGVEVKAGSVTPSDGFNHLRWFKENMASNQPFVGIVLYSGPHTARFGPDMWAIPYGALYADA